MENTQTEQVISLEEEIANAFDNVEVAPPQEEVEIKEETTEEVTEEVTEEAENKDEVIEEEKTEVEKEFEKEFPLVPNDWSKEEKEVFEAMLNSESEDVKLGAELFIDRYNNFKKGFIKKTTEYANFKNDYKEADEILKPYENMFKQSNLSKGAYLKKLIDLDRKFGENPAELVKDLIKSKGLKASDLGFEDFNLLDIEKNDNIGNSEVQQLRNEIAKLKNQVEISPIEMQVNNFANARDNEGKLLHPHFNDIRPIMAGIIQKDPDVSLEQAYKKALKVMDIEGETKQTTEPKIDLEARRQRAKQAIQASKKVSTTGNSNDFGKMTLEEEILARLDGKL